MILILIAILTIICFWVVAYLRFNDFQVPKKSLKSFKNVMVIFPHPDDESLSCAGTLNLLKRSGSSITLVVLTKGERGVEGALLTPSLKPARTKEMINSASYIGIDNLIIEDFGDGTLASKHDQIKEYLNKIIKKTQPDLIITYDKSGLYGHPDHMIVSEITTSLAITLLTNYALWYVSRPQKFYDQFKLPTYMAENKEFLKRRQLPTFRVRLGPYEVYAKIKSIYSHKSQHFAFTKNLPPLVPLWFMVSSQIDEYFHAVDVRK